MTLRAQTRISDSLARRLAAMRLAIATVAFRQAQVQAQTERNIVRLVAAA